MPTDRTPAGGVFGGWAASQMDLAIGNFAALTSRGRAATGAVDHMNFPRPVTVGDNAWSFASITQQDRMSRNNHVTA